MPLEDGTNRVVDLDSGDIYVWDSTAGESGMYVLEEKEVVTEYVAVEVDTDNGESSDLKDTVSDLEVQVMALEDDVTLLSDEVSTLSVYDAASDYNLGATNQTIFQGLVSKVPYGQSYVYWRDGQYSYKFAYGELSLDGVVFTGTGDVTIVSYDTTGSSYNNYYTWSVVTDSVFSLDAGERLVYSDLGNYPGMGERRMQEYVAITAYVAFGVMLFALLDRLRVACFRR